MALLTALGLLLHVRRWPMKLEIIAMGVRPEAAEPIAKMLITLLACPPAHVVVKQLPETGDAWRHVYVPQRLAVKAHLLLAAYNQGACDALDQHRKDMGQ